LWGPSDHKEDFLDGRGYFYPENLDLFYSRLEWHRNNVRAWHDPAHPNHLFLTGNSHIRVQACSQNPAGWPLRPLDLMFAE
jgi:hypothetical protein